MVVFLSRQYRDTVKKRLPLFFRKSRTTVIPNGIDLKLFAPSSKSSSDVIRIGMQSRLLATKDHVTLINSFSRCLNNYKNPKKLLLHIAGDGECKPALQQLANELGLQHQVIFL